MSLKDPPVHIQNINSYEISGTAETTNLTMCAISKIFSICIFLKI